MSECLRCRSGALVATKMPGSLSLQMYQCSSCGARYSDAGCKARGCNELAITQCVECHETKCGRHGPNKSLSDKPLCNRCRTKYRMLLRPNPPRKSKLVQEQEDSPWWHE